MKWLGYLAVVVLTVIGVSELSFAQNVTYKRLLHADDEPQNWLMSGGNYQAWRFSPLKQINTANVGTLKAAWIYQPAQSGQQEASAVVVNGIMYITEAPSGVTALDAKYGTKIWSWSPKLPRVIYHVGSHLDNRGIAILGNTIYVGTVDAHLVALDAKTGAMKWDVHIADNKENYGINSAPLVINEKVIVGIGGGDGGARGFVDAYDAKTGQRLWRVYTIPAQGDPVAKTWGDDMTGLGGGGTWVTGSYDASLNLLYWGTGNPAPSFNRAGRPGDNLYTCSLLAIDPDTGKMKWYFQFTPHDTHDWDSAQTPVLFDATVDHEQRKFVAMANRNGFYYVLDRVTGKFAKGVPFVKVTWAKGLDENGRPIYNGDPDPTPKGTLVYPAVMGGADWTAPAYSPLTKMFYVNAHELGAYFYSGQPRLNPNGPPGYGGGGQNALSGDKAYGALRALDSVTGKLIWQYRLLAPAWVSPLVTAGSLVFAGTDEGNFFALDAEKGKLLWEFNLGGSGNVFRTNSITYAVNGKQYVLAVAGNDFVAFTLP
ncbi:MAG TPA: PQQ-dependent dehydrogenase, methanol/ethanol family [Verrucomicrobiae bacterium]|nr:PQQ-dependent dehydrogenase, methanol/ethanol family [Verrucomicrobiae bacterium]